jgi:putative MATE family efflux protein
MDAEDKGSANAGAKPSGKDVKPSGNGHRKTASNHVLDPTSYGSIWRLAWPVMVSMGAHTAFTIIDLYWIGALGTDALAAVSLIGNVLFCLFGFTQIVYVGALAMLSRRVGAGDLKGKDGAEGVAAQALQLSFLLGVGITILGVAAARPSVALFGTSETVAKLSVAYLIPMLVGFLPVYPLMALISFFTAGGDTRTPMQVGVAASLFNAALDPFLIFGWAGFPAWGVAGAGIASLVSAMLNLAALWVLYAVRELPFPRAHPFKWSGTRAYRTLFRIGIPASLGMLTRPASTVILLGVIAQFGTAGVAAFGVTVRALSLVWLYQGGLYTAVSTLTGRSLGAKNVGGISGAQEHLVEPGHLNGGGGGLFRVAAADHRHLREEQPRGAGAGGRFHTAPGGGQRGYLVQRDLGGGAQWRRRYTAAHGDRPRGQLGDQVAPGLPDGRAVGHGRGGRLVGHVHLPSLRKWRHLHLVRS